MAKIFRTETLDLAGNIRLAASEAGAFEITNSGGSTLMSKATIENDISSLKHSAYQMKAQLIQMYPA